MRTVARRASMSVAATLLGLVLSTGCSNGAPQTSGNPSAASVWDAPAFAASPASSTTADRSGDVAPLGTSPVTIALRSAGTVRPGSPTLASNRRPAPLLGAGDPIGVALFDASVSGLNDEVFVLTDMEPLD